MITVTRQDGSSTQHDANLYTDNMLGDYQLIVKNDSSTGLFVHCDIDKYDVYPVDADFDVFKFACNDAYHIDLIQTKTIGVLDLNDMQAVSVINLYLMLNK